MKMEKNMPSRGSEKNKFLITKTKNQQLYWRKIYLRRSIF